MNLRVSVLAMLITLVIGVDLLAQPLREPTYEMKLEYAYELVSTAEYYNALEMFQECYQESRDETLLYPIAQMNFKLRDFERAEKYYERAFKKDPQRTNVIALLDYAKCLKINQKYGEALEYFQEFLTRSPSDSLSYLAENEMIGMEDGTKFVLPKDIFATPLDNKNVNSGITDLSPGIGADGNLYFATFGKRSKIVIEDLDGEYHLGIYSSKKNKDGEWSKRKKESSKLNREGFHTGNVSFSPDGNTMYFTRTRLEGDRILESIIYASEWDGKKWQGPQELSGVNGDWIATHPSMGELFGERVMYFVSDMPGTYGGWDIFYSKHQGGLNFSDPVNLGAEINGPGNEITPYYLDGMLYFASDGYPGLGGYDQFQSLWNGSEWSSPKNMGLPYNTPYDDMYFKYVDDGKNGYMVSNRPYKGKKSPKNETCCDDIFEVNTQEVELDLIALVFDEQEQALEGATVTISEIRRKGKIPRDAQTNSAANNFNFPLQLDKAFSVVVERDGFYPDSVEINTVGYAISHTFEEVFFLKAKEPETIVVTINEPIRLDNIYYDFNDDQILPESEGDLELLVGLMNQYPDMVIELSSHTDSRGRPSYNKDLSQRRANNAATWLVENGEIDPKRIQPRGYGEEQLLNECSDGVDCTEDQHRLNRRTEFKILEGPRTIEIKKEVKNPNSNDGSSGSIYEPEDYFGNWRTLALIDKSDLFEVIRNPEISFTKSFHDFEVITEGELAKCSFEFINSGDDDLLIEWVNCNDKTVVKWPTEPIPPGESGLIEVAYNSLANVGEQEVSVSIISNTDPTIVEARFRAFVERSR